MPQQREAAILHLMNKRHSIYYLVAAYLGYIAYSLIKDIREGSPTATSMNILTVGFFSLAALGIAAYTTILVHREKKEQKQIDKQEEMEEPNDSQD